ncbi:MAG TPA: DUF3592 domain-containing protein [Usitatibacter sp.]|nr:DUF3592 domain-containing protein [Usitatibacter sp.]
MTLRQKLEGAAAVLLAIVGAIAFAVMGITSHADLEAGRALARNGVQTTATITGLQVSGRRSRSYYADYHYTVAGRKWERRGKVDRDGYEALAEGMLVPVRFDPSEPGNAILGEELALRESWGERFGPFVACVFLALALASKITMKRRRDEPRKPRDTRRKSRSPSSGSRRGNRSPR